MSKHLLRSLPRTFWEGFPHETGLRLPDPELNKLRKVLRLGTGDPIAILPNDGSIWQCELKGFEAVPKFQYFPDTEPAIHLTMIQALPKGDKLEEIIRSSVGLGVSKYVVFPSDRTVVRWDDQKVESRLARLRAIIREEAEVTYRMRLPELVHIGCLAEVFESWPDAEVLSESELESQPLEAKPAQNERSIVVGPEGGWSETELSAIGNRGRTLGPRVLRVQHAGPAAAALILLAAKSK